MPFQGYHFPLSSLYSGLRFPPSSATLRILLVLRVWIPVLGWVWEGSPGTKGTFSALPSLPQASPSQSPGSHPAAWLERCSALPPFSQPIPSNTQCSGTRNSVGRDSYCLFAFLPGLSARFSTVNFDFSAKLKLFSSEALKKKWFFSALLHSPFTNSSLCPFNLLVTSGIKALSLHESPAGAASPSPSLTVLSPEPQFGTAAPGCWNIVAENAGYYSLLFMEKAAGHSCTDWGNPCFKLIWGDLNYKLNRLDRKENAVAPVLLLRWRGIRDWIFYRALETHRVKWLLRCQVGFSNAWKRPCPPEGLTPRFVSWGVQAALKSASKGPAGSHTDILGQSTNLIADLIHSCPES